MLFQPQQIQISEEIHLIGASGDSRWAMRTTIAMAYCELIKQGNFRLCFGQEIGNRQAIQSSSNNRIVIFWAFSQHTISQIYIGMVNIIFLKILKEMIKRTSKYELDKGSLIMNSSYNVIQKLGSGAFGNVFMIVKNTFASEDSFKNIPDQASIKIQKQTQLLQQDNTQIHNQARIIKELTSEGVEIGFTKLYYEGKEGGHNFIVIDLLGPNLKTLLDICGGTFSLKTSLLLMFQVFQRLQFIHSKGYIYCDIKPENFSMGIQNNSHILYIIDFGLSKKYKNTQTGLHQPYKQNKMLNGTLRYASIASQFGIAQSRRDDLQSACYLLIYFLKGNLPWEGYKKGTVQSKENWILQKKLKNSAETLCQGLPYQIQNILQYCQELQFYEDPDYNFINNSLKDLYTRQEYEFDYAYDWTLVNKKVQQKKGPIKLVLYPDDHDVIF